MRAVMILTGALLWLNAFACREEMWQAYALASSEFEMAAHSGNMAMLGKGLLAGAFVLLTASPLWKLIAGFSFVRLSVEIGPSRSAAGSGDTA
jgi:hypothetical protein